MEICRALWEVCSRQEVHISTDASSTCHIRITYHNYDHIRITSGGSFVIVMIYKMQIASCYCCIVRCICCLFICFVLIKLVCNNREGICALGMYMK
jgi:hypothetical protein